MDERLSHRWTVLRRAENLIIPKALLRFSKRFEANRSTLGRLRLGVGEGAGNVAGKVVGGEGNFGGNELLTALMAGEGVAAIGVALVGVVDQSKVIKAALARYAN